VWCGVVRCGGGIIIKSVQYLSVCERNDSAAAVATAAATAAYCRSFLRVPDSSYLKLLFLEIMESV